MLGFMGGILVAFISALLAILVQRHHENFRRREQAQLDIYMKLLELNSAYFWIATAELHKEESKLEYKRKAFDLSWKIADTMRANDNVEYIGEILEILFGSKYCSAQERAKSLSSIIEKYSKIVNPTYGKLIKNIIDENMISIASGCKNYKNAPGSSII